MNIKQSEIIFGNNKIILETGKIARQADGSVMIKCGNTVMLCTAVVSKKVDESKDFLPLMVNYLEKYYAAGKFPGGYMKREGKPSENEVLRSRLIDRSLRPLFPNGFCNDVQVIVQLISYDKKADCDMLAMIGASAACVLAGLPIINVVGGCRVALIDNELKLVSDINELKSSKLDLFVAGTSSSILMVESQADEISEAIMLDAMILAQKTLVDIIAGIKAFANDVAKSKMQYKPIIHDELYESIKVFAHSKLKDAYKIVPKQERVQALNIVEEETIKEFLNEHNKSSLILSLLKKLEKDVVRSDILKTKKRIDGRGVEDVRKITVEVDVLPKECVHGSALFTRGETQALATVTLGSAIDEQMIDGLDDLRKERFLLHYNFLPFSVGEIDVLRGTGRREVGHGKLAYKALQAMLPTKEEFPYSIRVVSEITESNGSSSMATVSGASLAMMSVGVPLKKPVSGIAMGLIKSDDDFVVLTDIVGDEDHLGDMDFKVGGTKDGITALQMDMKINGINMDIMKSALKQALDARIFILGKMSEVITNGSTLSDFVPKALKMQIPVEKIGDVIGKSGATIKEICEKTGVKINIENDGTVCIFAPSQEAGDEAMEIVNHLIATIEVGQIYEGTVSKLMTFGAMVDLPGKKSGMVHISEISMQRIENIEDHLKVGDKVKVKVLGFDERRRMKLSIKATLPDYNGSERTGTDRENGGNRDGNPRNSRSSNHGNHGNRDNGGRRDNYGNRDNRSGHNDRKSSNSANFGVDSFIESESEDNTVPGSFADLARNINS